MASENPKHAGSPRLLLKSDVTHSGCVYGAWWPRSDDLASELPDLFAALGARLGAVGRVLYKFSDWAKAPGSILLDGSMVELGESRFQPPNTIEVIGLDHSRIVLLVVPPHTEPDHAHAGMTAAAEPEDSSTVDELLMISLQRREHRTQQGSAEQRWNSQVTPPLLLRP